MFAVEEPNISTIDEGETGLQRNQEHAQFFLQHSWASSHEFISRDHTINGKFMRHLREDIGQNCGARAIRFFMMICHNTCVSRPYQYGDPIALALLTRFCPCDIFLFPKMKLQLNGHCFDTVEEIQYESQELLHTLGEQYFQKAFAKWQRLLERCIVAQGDY